MFRSVKQLSRFSNLQLSSVISRRTFSNVWGQRTMDWINEVVTEHMEDHEGEYPFSSVPFLAESSDEPRTAVVTPCVSQATCSFFIDEMIKRKFHVHSVAVPEANLEFIESRFKMTDAVTAAGDSDVVRLESKDPPITVDKRRIETFKPLNNALESVDIVFDEMPLLEFAQSSDLKSMGYELSDSSLKCTMFGHSLKVGGLLYVQTEAANNFKERQALLAKVNQFYPPSHFVLINTRRLTWTRQFLYLKADSTVQKSS